ncbi:MAG: flagellar hook-associated protein FlgL [Acidobacteriia bacterium]|nr:flagellar hook-associated protein FlgL [Terriglobia bacterium]
MRVNPDFTADILTNLWQSQSQVDTALQQISTGRRVNMPSDDPAAAAADVQNQAAQQQTDQYIQSSSSLEGLLQTADSTLSSVVTALNHAIALGVQGANGTLSAADQQAIAQQVQGIRDQVVQLANVSYKGSFIFAGTATTTPPFTLDSTQPSGVRYNGNAGTNSVEIAQGRSLQVNLPGAQVFQGSGGDVMASLQQLLTALQSGNTTAIGTATTQIRGALDYLSQQRVFYGNGVNQLTSNQSFLQQEKVNLQSQENSLVGVDLAKAATDLSKAQTTHNAALAAVAKVIPQSLLDYLK